MDIHFLKKIRGFKPDFVKKWLTNIRFLVILVTLSSIFTLGYWLYLRTPFIEKKRLESQVIDLTNQLAKKQKLVSIESNFQKNLKFLKQKFFLHPEAAYL